MAGASRRFAEAGYGRPKYMLELSGRPLFDWAVASFRASFPSESFAFVVREDGETAPFVEARCAALGIGDRRIVALDRPTAGQAETVEIGLARSDVADDVPLAIFNIDTIRPSLDPSGMPGCDGWLETFPASGDHWSFVEPDPDDSERVLRTTEKQRISDHSCTGFYQFARADLFAQALKAERTAPSSHELFVAPLYNHLIARGHRIGWREVEADRVILAGVPAEYEALLAKPPAALVALDEELAL